MCYIRESVNRGHRISKAHFTPLKNDFTVVATPISAAFLPTVAFSLGVKCS